MFKKLLVIISVFFIITSCTTNSSQEIIIENNLTPNKIEENYKGYITFWFDDGYSSSYDIVFQEFKVRGWNAVISVLGNREYAEEIFYPKSIIAWDKVQELQSNGWEISNHSMHHLHLNNFDNKDSSIFEEEIIESKNILENLGFEINSFTFPYGEQGKTVGQKYVSENHDYWRSSQKGINEIPAWRHLLSYAITSETSSEEIKNLISTTEQSNGWLIINLHDISKNPYDKWDQSIDQFMELIKIIESSNLQVVIPEQMYLRYGYAEEKNINSYTNLWNNEMIIEIEKIGVNSELKEANIKNGIWDFQELENYPLWISSTPIFGDVGLSAILGHRQWGIVPKVFAKLNMLEYNDIINVGNIKYFVQYTKIIKPEELYIIYDQLNKSFYEINVSALMLITCTPYGTDKQRLLVIAQREETE